MRSFIFKLLFILVHAPLVMQAQINDCAGAQVVCSNSDLTLNPQGPGFNDFDDPDNDPACMIDLENNTAWYYFEIDEDAPTGLILGFIIHPNGGLGEDYDWALYGPNVSCRNLGSPVRCSSSSAQCDFCPETGMGMGTTDVSEGPGSGDGFVMTLQVEPGQGFYLMIDNWQGTHNGFVLSWTGTAADHLNCDADPCDLVADAGQDLHICGGDSSTIILDGSSRNNLGNESYRWAGSNGATDFLSDSNIAKPTLHLPVDFTGTIFYTLTVSEDSCTNKDKLTVIVSKPEVSIIPSGPFCESSPSKILSASPPGGTWGGAVSGNIFNPMTLGTGIHTVIYTYTEMNSSCSNSDSIHIEVLNTSGITITLGEDAEIPLGESFSVEANSNFPLDQIDTVIWSPDQMVECLDPACFNVIISPLNDFTLTATIFDLIGCSTADELRITVNKDLKVYIPNAFSPNDDGINDLFFISGNHNLISKIKKLVVFNRWGAVVHESIDFLPGDLMKGWDGYDKNGKINPGVFVYIVEVEFIDGSVLKYGGDVMVVR